ncbi:MAG: hypothetical protein HYS06_10520 [Methylocystis sp.]|nr:hypothetical protein [Methylocystis sp.]MBI3274403.1 hypothetical protein [Methylocystis sp.]
MTKTKIVALALLAATVLSARAEAFCFFGCKPTAADSRKVFENLVKQKFDPNINILSFEETRFWELDVEGFPSHESYFTAVVVFPNGANLDCKPEGPAGAKTVKAGCSASTFYSTTISNQMVKERQYIAPGSKIEFHDETRFDTTPQGWKGRDGNYY